MWPGVSGGPVLQRVALRHGVRPDYRVSGRQCPRALPPGQPALGEGVANAVGQIEPNRVVRCDGSPLGVRNKKAQLNAGLFHINFDILLAAFSGPPSSGFRDFTAFVYRHHVS
jgi:hypothetical protein